MITHEIDLNVGQPNNKQFIHINQGEYDSVQIMAHIWNKNKPYTIDADKIRIEGKLSSGALLFDGDSAIQIVKENDTTVSFILTKPIAASVGSFNFSLLFYKGSDVLKKTFPFTIRVSGNPANNVKSDAVLDGVIKKLEQQEQEYNQLATVAKTGDYNDLINKPSGLTITTNLFKPIYSGNIHGKKCVILVNSDNTMTVKNDSADSQTFKIGTAHVTKGTVYKFICYSSDYENLKNTSVQINGTDYIGLDHYEYTADVSGDIDISICTNANNMGTYTIYPMLTPNLAATTNDYVPHTGIYDEINWDVSELNRGILRYPTLKLYDNDKYGGITYDGTDNTLSVSYVNNKYPKFICDDLTANETEVSNLTVGDWLPIGKSDIVLKRYDMNDEGETYITDTISLYDFYTNTSKKFDEIDHSIENLYGTTELYLRKAGDSMTGALRIYVDKIKGSAATGADPIVFAITPEQNTSLFTVTTKTMTRNGNTVFSNYQSAPNTTHINTSKIKFWNTEFIRSESTESLNLTLPKISGTIALISDIPKAGNGTADIAASVTDYGDTAKHIQIGFSGAGITGDDIKYIAGYTGGDGGNLSAKIKDISKDALKAWLGLGSRAYDSTNYLPSNGGDLDGTLHVKPTTGSYTEGMRVYPYEGWSTVMLNGTDNTGTSGTSPKSWGLFNNDGQFYITKNGANTSPTAIFSNTDGTWRANGHELITAGNIGSQNVNYANSAGSANSVAWGNVSGRPTALSSFTNDKGYINGITKAMVTDALGYTPPTSDTNTTYSAGTGLNLSGTAFSVKYGSAAGTACQGNDSRLSNARPASDVYSWAKASSKPSYTWTEISNKPDIPSISKYTPTRTNWTINSEYNCVVYRIGDFCLAVVAVTGTIYPRQWLPAAQLSKDFTPKIQSSIVVCSVSGSDHMECMVTKDGYIKMWWSGSSPATSANICVPYYMG